MPQSFAMNGGDGTYSYTNNSTWQRNGANAVKDLIMEAVINNLDVETMSGSGSGSGSSSVMFTIADLGCSVGPNTFYAMQTLIEFVQRKYGRSSDDTGLEFQVFFNDKLGNDFNTLFASLPHPRKYWAEFLGRWGPGLFQHQSVPYFLHPDRLFFECAPLALQGAGGSPGESPWLRIAYIS